MGIRVTKWRVPRDLDALDEVAAAFQARTGLTVVIKRITTGTDPAEVVLSVPDLRSGVSVRAPEEPGGWMDVEYLDFPPNPDVASNLRGALESIGGTQAPSSVPSTPPRV